MANMVKLREVLNFCRMRKFELNQDLENFLISPDTFFGKKGRVDQIYFNENQVEIFIKFMKRLCFINDFDKDDMLYTYTIANYSSNVLLLDIIPVIEMNKPLG